MDCGFHKFNKENIGSIGCDEKSKTEHQFPDAYVDLTIDSDDDDTHPRDYEKSYLGNGEKSESEEVTGVHDYAYIGTGNISWDTEYAQGTYETIIARAKPGETLSNTGNVFILQPNECIYEEVTPEEFVSDSDSTELIETGYFANSNNNNSAEEYCESQMISQGCVGTNLEEVVPRFLANEDTLQEEHIAQPISEYKTDIAQEFLDTCEREPYPAYESNRDTEAESNTISDNTFGSNSAQNIANKDADVIDLDCCSDSDDDATLATSNELLQNSANHISMLTCYMCPECNESCGNRKNWKWHIDAQHGFNSLKNMNLEAVVNKDGELCHQCRECYQKFDLKSTFSKVLNHRITHSAYRNIFKCRLCESRYNSRPSLWKHMKTAHTKLYQANTRKTKELNSKHIRYHCPICNLALEQKSHWKMHLEDNHNYAEQLKNNFRSIDKHIVECYQCNRRIREKRALEHLMTHEAYQPFHCKLCNTFNSNSSESCLAHIRVQHYQGGTRFYYCIYCDTKFDQLCKYKQHLKNRHKTNSRRPQCHVCKLTFASHAYLLSHMNIQNHLKLK